MEKSCGWRKPQSHNLIPSVPPGPSPMIRSGWQLAHTPVHSSYGPCGGAADRMAWFENGLTEDLSSTGLGIWTDVLCPPWGTILSIISEVSGDAARPCTHSWINTFSHLLLISASPSVLCLGLQKVTLNCSHFSLWPFFKIFLLWADNIDWGNSNFCSSWWTSWSST